MSQIDVPNAPDRQVTRDTWLLACVLIAMACLLAAVVAAGLAFRASDDASRAAKTGLAAGAKTAVAPTGSPQHVAVELGDLYIKPSSIEVPAGTPLVFEVTNKGPSQHNFSADGKTTPMVDAGGTATLEVPAVQKSFTAFCTVPGHRPAGMTMNIEVTGAPATTAAGGTGTAASSKGARIDPAATPGPNWKPFDPKLTPADGATEHKVTFHATEKVIEVAPGVKQELWTFNDTVPGPVLRGHVGDVFTVTLVNDGKMGHSIDFHASETAMDHNMRTLKPGESLVYQFKASRAGIWMYHCGTAPALHHIGNGMYGAVIIDPPGLAPVDQEFVFVQSEFYLGPSGQPGDLSKMTAVTPDAVVFNGYFQQYKFAPIHIAVGKRIRIWVLDAGPNENSAFHVVGTQFDTVYKEGAYLLRPGPDQGGSQTLDLQPAQGGFVELSPAEAGSFAIVTHKFANVGKGALGMFMAS